MYFEIGNGKFTSNKYYTYLSLTKRKRNETFSLHYCMICNTT